MPARLENHRLVISELYGDSVVPRLVFVFSTCLNVDYTLRGSITLSAVTLGMNLLNNFLGIQVRHFAKDNVLAIKPWSWGESDEKSMSVVN